MWHLGRVNIPVSQEYFMSINLKETEISVNVMGIF
jgi:hypothetical protein